MYLKFACAAVLVALAWPAHADQFEWCSGVWFHQEDHDRVGECLIKLDTDAFLQVGHFCDAHGHCAFMGHVAGRAGDGFYIDRIGGKTKPR
jgi:hypothetical protein